MTKKTRYNSQFRTSYVNQRLSIKSNIQHIQSSQYTSTRHKKIQNNIKSRIKISMNLYDFQINPNVKNVT